MNKKYEFTGKEKKVLGKTLKQIVCVTAFSFISVGDVGGWIESEGNLDQSGDAWVSGNALVYGNARVCGNAEVYGNARVYGNAEVLTKKAITISSNHYHVTITDTHITIGCQNYKKEFWANADFDEIKKLDGEKSAETFMKFKPFIMKLAEVD